MVPMQSTHCWLPRPVDIFIPLLLLFFLVSLFLFEKMCLLLVLYSISPQLQLCGPDLLKVCVQTNNRQKQKHLVITVEAHPLRESNAGGDLHSSKIMHSVNSEYVDTGVSERMHRILGGENGNKLFSGCTVIYQN